LQASQRLDATAPFGALAYYLYALSLCYHAYFPADVKFLIVIMRAIRIIRKILSSANPSTMLTKAKTPPQRRNRTIRWPSEIDLAAVDLAFDRKMHGGVSELLTRLVLAEAKRKRGIVHLQTLP
jgi:hypothetical protein